MSLLIAEIDKTLPPELPSSDDNREKLAKRQANAAVALLKMNQSGKVWPLLKHSPDPRVRSDLIHKLSPLGADAQAIVKRVNEETEITIRRALLLSLGEHGEKDFSLEDDMIPARSRIPVPELLACHVLSPRPIGSTRHRGRALEQAGAAPFTPLRCVRGSELICKDSDRAILTSSVSSLSHSGKPTPRAPRACR